MPDSGDDDLAFQQLRELLEGASAQAAGGGPSGADRFGTDPFSTALPGVARDLMDRQLGVPASARTAPAADLIMMRSRARRLSAVVGDALSAALVIRKMDLELDPERGLARASAIGSGVRRALGLLRDLGPDFDLQLDFGHDLRLAGELTTALARSDSFRPGHARALLAGLLAGLSRARHRISDLALALDSLPVDASGQDLSAIEIGELTPLNGVTWDAETTWPPGLARRVRPYSRPARPGAYQVRIPYGTRD
jgi:hypothetical protein